VQLFRLDLNFLLPRVVQRNSWFLHSLNELALHARAKHGLIAHERALTSVGCLETSQARHRTNREELSAFTKLELHAPPGLTPAQKASSVSSSIQWITESAKPSSANSGCSLFSILSFFDNNICCYYRQANQDPGVSNSSYSRQSPTTELLRLRARPIAAKVRLEFQTCKVAFRSERTPI
jgi:hypothetical protein